MDSIKSSVEKMSLEEIFAEVSPDEAKEAMRQSQTALRKELAEKATTYRRDMENPSLLADNSEAQVTKYFLTIEKRMRTLMWAIRHIDAKLKASDEALWEPGRGIPPGLKPSLKNNGRKEKAHV